MPFALRAFEGPDADWSIYDMTHDASCEEIDYREFWEFTGTQELRRAFPKYNWGGEAGERLCDDLRVRYFRTFIENRLWFFVRRNRRIWPFPFKELNTFEERLEWIDHCIELHRLEITEGKGPTKEEMAAMCKTYDGPWEWPPKFHLGNRLRERAALLKRHAN